ncbi:hypothetical protein ACIREM_32905 [Streptomyces shenzhenensis]|uniref:hypothetical protein n=1 Tax=Streptomyces shenzhenensis TaxID=943815 RepID=UPI0038302861
MSELPTAAEPSTTPDVASALRAIEAAKLADPEIAECLDAIGDLIRITGEPDTVFDWVTKTLGREHLRAWAFRSGITLHESRATEEEQPPRAFIVWAAEGEAFAIIPAEQPPARTLLQLREELAQHDEELRLAVSFQASVAAGHVEDVDAWHARTTQTAK